MGIKVSEIEYPAIHEPFRFIECRYAVSHSNQYRNVWRNIKRKPSLFIFNDDDRFLRRGRGRQSIKRQLNDIIGVAPGPE